VEFAESLGHSTPITEVAWSIATHLGEEHPEWDGEEIASKVEREL
jgi:hypothetical protein